MVRKCLLLTSYLFILFSSVAIAQENKKEITTLIESLSWLQTNDDLSQSDILENLQYLAQHPLDLNTADEESLQELFFLTGFQKFALLNYRKQYGKILSPYELMLIPGFDSTTVSVLSHFATYSAPQKAHYRGNKISHTTSITYARTLEQADGFVADSGETPAYIGKPHAYQLRYHLQMGKHSSLFITADHDTGERFDFSKKQRGTDFTSLSLSTTKTPGIDQLVLGDYRISAGQGMVLWNGFGAFKSLTTPGSRYSQKTLRPYHSASESSFLRGAACAKKIDNWYIAPFFSYTPRDATINTNTEGSKYVQSFYTAGIHNTETTFSKKETIDERILGVIIKKSWNYLHLGSNFCHQNFEYPVEDSRTGFSADNNYLFSLDYTYFASKTLLYGEFAVQQFRNFALVQGIHWHPFNDLHTSMAFRYFSPSFYNPYAQPLSELGASNEWGLLTKCTVNLPGYITIGAYWDIFRIPQTSYNSTKPFTGYEMALQIAHQPSFYNFKLRFATQNKTYNQSLEDLSTPERAWEEQTTYKGQLQLRSSSSKPLEVTLDLYGNLSIAGEKNEKGWLSALTLQRSLNNSQIILRYALFNTSDYLSRIYTYEHDVRYRFSIPAFAGKGSRAFLVGKIRIARDLDILLKLSRSFYPEKESLRSGPARLPDNHQTEATLQLFWKI